MLRLWPKSVKVALLAGPCWVKHGGTVSAVPVNADADSPSAMLREVLQQLKPATRQGALLDIVLPDQAASISALTWQHNLHNSSEVREYARLGFERDGHPLAAGKLLHAEFRHYLGMGLAYAVPADTLASLAETAISAGMRLRSAMPVSAWCYFQKTKAASKHQYLHLQLESDRITAMLYESRRMVRFDVEPVTASVTLATRRQLLRMLAMESGIRQGRLVALDDDKAAEVMPMLAEEFSELAFSHISAKEWL